MNAELAYLVDTERAKSWRDWRDPTLSTMYEVQRREKNQLEVCLAVWSVAALYIMFSAVDAVLISDVLDYAVTVRVVVGLSYAVGISLQLRFGVRQSLIEAQCGIGVVVGYLAWLVLTSFSSHTQNALNYASYGLVFMLVANVFYNLQFRIALLTSGMIAVSFAATSTRVFEASFEYYVAMDSLYVLSFLLTIYINWKLNAERYSVFLNSLAADLRHREARDRGEELRILSATDALTGLANRRATDEVLQIMWGAWKNDGASFGVILVDVDYFKMFNDFYGHQIGDTCLVRVANAMKGVIGPYGGELGRFGGEEFIALMASGSPEHLVAVANETREAVQKLQIPHEARSDHLSVVTVSVGVAFSPHVVGRKAERIVTDADRALYFAKDSNRNCVKLFDQRLVETETTTDSIIEALRSGISKGLLSLAYQPIWNVQTGRLFAAEALMRLIGTNGSLIPPSVFIPVAEKTGLIVELGEWAIREVCRELLNNSAIPLISVNVSAVQIGRPGFASSVAAILLGSGVSPERLAVEITEGAEIVGNSVIEKAIADLTLLGVNVWLDDFGTGFAGLSCLTEIDFNTVKIDRLFVQASETERGAKLLTDMMRLVRNSGHKLIVEGVESKEEVEFLKDRGATLLQGYYFNRPMSAEALKLLARKQTLVSAQRAV